MRFRATGLCWTLVAGADLRLAVGSAAASPNRLPLFTLVMAGRLRISLRIHQHVMDTYRLSRGRGAVGHPANAHAS